ncbi:TPA: CpsD/CapB family tyrosine-protein kinase [Bacillus cereus]|uniref:CpsD/CapB family tyrosine-protein kinase n=1 Tax=Bacillus cereus TaxID=1396 RepID=UPI0019277DD5|nr:CpsD/CapB family tyrosine-protein kinase [Bacillus cereus]MBL3764334.1 CpsD/CapB family tyrosine-protein kinase [Bacillus cereus]MBL3769891.1 CpsD/CapB family tyrosine-protein kinase [Bacillus cereus]MBL3776019.1 CpsD/CapB family tyrosine-protein kinase [Bacillus cereus]MBL3787306.1 CpsD/CapB family tyrosine-protein kinase [Bacillus cereus]BCC48267.1 tyrosine-protein kinase [Bacillus cereus]
MEFKKKKKSFFYPVAYKKPNSLISEQYRNIRTNILFASANKKIRSLVITSANAGEGKTMTVVNIAIMFAKQGKKVLLVDADLRNPNLHYVLHQENIFGLSNILLQDSHVEECVKNTYIENLSFLSSGSTSSNPAELLGSNMMYEFLSKAYINYDFVMFDTPPALGFADVKLLTNQCDASVLVVRSGKTEKKTALKAKELLNKSNGRLLGAILNDKQERNIDYYYE